MKKFLNNIQPRKLFLIDSIGAFVSAIMLGLILTNFVHVFGMPKEILIYLACAACLFCIYSLSCYLQFPKRWWIYMKIIAIINIFYCTITLGFVIHLADELTVLGFIYFIGEITIVILLAAMEWKTASKGGQTNEYQGLM